MAFKKTRVVDGNGISNDIGFVDVTVTVVQR
jgi:hypothetical protein